MVRSKPPMHVVCIVRPCQHVSDRWCDATGFCALWWLKISAFNTEQNAFQFVMQTPARHHIMSQHAQRTVCCVATVHRARHQNGDAGAAGCQSLSGAQGTCITCQLASCDCSHVTAMAASPACVICTRPQQSTFSRDEQVGTEHVLLGLVWEEINSTPADWHLKEGVWSAADASAARLGASYNGLGLHPKAVRDANAWVRAGDVSAVRKEESICR